MRLLCFCSPILTEVSDIIFLRGWYPITPRKFYNPVTSLLAEDGKWQAMRLTGQVRREQGIKTPLNINSAYRVSHCVSAICSIVTVLIAKPVERPSRRFNPLRIPRKLQAALPYVSKPKIMKAQRTRTYMQKRAVVLEPEEKKAITMLQQIRALRKDQVARRKEKQAERKEGYKKKIAKIDTLKADARTAERKEKRRREARSSTLDGSREGGGRNKKLKTT